MSTVGAEAVKYFGFTGGNGSGWLDGSSECICNCGGAGVAAVVPPVPVCAPAIAVTLRTDAKPANIQFVIFKESFLRRRSPRTALLLHLNFDRNGKPPSHSKRLSRHLQHRCRLLALVLTPLHQLYDRTAPAQRQPLAPPQSARQSNNAPHTPQGSGPAPHTAAASPYPAAPDATPPKAASPSSPSESPRAPGSHTGSSA